MDGWIPVSNQLVIYRITLVIGLYFGIIINNDNEVTDMEVFGGVCIGVLIFTIIYAKGYYSGLEDGRKPRRKRGE